MQAYKGVGTKRNEKKNVTNIYPIKTVENSSITFFDIVILNVGENEDDNPFPYKTRAAMQAYSCISRAPSTFLRPH